MLIKVVDTWFLEYLLLSLLSASITPFKHLLLYLLNSSAITFYILT